MAEEQEESTLSRLLWVLVPMLIGAVIVALMIISEEYGYSLLGNALYGLLGVFMAVFGVWKLHVLYQVIFKGKQGTHHGEPIEKGSFHYKLLLFHAGLCGLIFPFAGAYLVYLAVTGNAI